MALPQLSAEDRQKYLKKAEEARRARAKLREDIKAGTVSLQKSLRWTPTLPSA